MGAGEIQPHGEQSQVTSEQLSGAAVAACWAFAIVLLGAGITATFTVAGGAAAAMMILLGSLLLIVALMRRIPLRIEVGGAKFDASYPLSQAFAAGREVGVHEGVEDAIAHVEEASEVGESADQALHNLRRTMAVTTWDDTARVTWEELERRQAPPGTVGYRAPSACSAAGATYRQVDYWARTGLVQPSVRPASTDGGPWLYSARDIILLKTVKRLLDAGVSLQQIRTAIKGLDQRSEEELERVTLMSDGQSVFVATSHAEVLDLLNSGRGLFGISLKGVAAEVQRALRELPGQQDETLPGME